MTIQRMIELLEIEHECMLRGAHDDCDRDCANCELVQDDSDLHEMYTDVIAVLKERPELVRCKDCIHYRYYGLTQDTVSECTIDHCENPDEEWYCADGEHKELGE